MSRCSADRLSDLSETKEPRMDFSVIRPGAIIVLLAWMLAPPAALAQPFFRRAFVDPPSQEVTAEF